MKRPGILALLYFVLCIPFSCTYECLDTDGREVDVKVRMNVATKSSYSALGSSVDNICLWVFRDGVLDSYGYYENCNAISLRLISGRQYSFYAVANSYRDLNELLPDFCEESQMTQLALPIDLFPLNQKERCMAMSASIAGIRIDGSTLLTLELVRLFSRIVLSFEPDDALSAEYVSVKSVMLCNTPSSVFPFMDEVYAFDGFDGDCANASDLRRLSAGGSIELYCPENCCGVSPNTDPRRKSPQDAPRGSATYLEITAQLSGASLSGSVVWRFCPGADNCCDYNLKRGYQYDITLHSLYSTLEDGQVDWQVDSREIDHRQENQIRLYAGQFKKIALGQGDEVAYFDMKYNSWLDFVYYSDEDDYEESLGNGCHIVSCHSTKSGVSANHELYVYSVSAAPSEARPVPLKIRHLDGGEETYVIYPPSIPSSFAGLQSVSLNEDGYSSDSYTLNIDGVLGIVDCEEFKIPDGYLGSGLNYSGKWDIFLALYSPEVVPCSGEDTPYGVEMAVSGLPYLNFWGKCSAGVQRAAIRCSLFSQEFSVSVSPAFPGQGYIGKRYNYVYAPNSLESNSGGFLPDGVSPHASWRVESDCDIHIRDNEILFGRTAYAQPAYGRQLLRGCVVNPHTLREIEGEYELDVVLYLPMIATECVELDDGLLGASVAVGSTSSFHSERGLWERVYFDLFNSEGKRVQMELRQGASYSAIVPSPDYEDAVFGAPYSSRPSNPTPEFIARYAPVSLVGFVDPHSGTTVRSLEIPGALLVRFEDVNEKITPACNIYGEGNRIYECLWGKMP